MTFPKDVIFLLSIKKISLVAQRQHSLILLVNFQILKTNRQEAGIKRLNNFR
jgi:hypothetical protein